jgi:protein SPA2
MVAVCNYTLPPASAQQSNEILQELNEHTNKLRQVQAMPEVTESRQIMAKSSVAVMNVMKELMKL